MFKAVLSVYITSNMAARGWKLKDIARESGVSDSTIHSYIKQKSDNPSDENLFRIADAFGDPQEVIQRMRQESDGVADEAARMVDEADDAARMEKFTAIVRSAMLGIMQEYLAATAAQQTEIIQHADIRIAQEQADFKRRTAEVVKQCHEENDRIEKACSEKLDMMEKHCSQRIEDMRVHMQEVVSAKGDAEAKITRQYNLNKDYLKSAIVHLIAAVGILLLTNIFFGAYAIFSYTVFDMADPTRGLHRETHSVGPMMLFLAIVALCIVAALVISLYRKRPKFSENEKSSLDTEAA